MGRMGRLLDNGSVAWVPLHVTALAAVAEQCDGIAIRVRKLREQAERCPGNSAVRGVAEEALLRFGRELRSRTAELKVFYESIILEDVSVLFERERLQLQRLIAAVEAPLQVRPPIRPLPVNAQDQVPSQGLGALLRKRAGALATVHSAPSTPKGTSRRHQSFVAPPDAPPVLQLPAKPALRLHTLRMNALHQNGAPSPRGGGVSPRGSSSPRTGSPPPSIFRLSAPGPAYVPSPLQGVSFPEPPTPPAAPSGRKQPKKHSFTLPDDACALDAPNSDEDPPPNEVPGRKEGTECEQDNQETGSATGPSIKPVLESEGGRVVELVVKLTAEEFDELMRLARQRTREA